MNRQTRMARALAAGCLFCMPAMIGAQQKEDKKDEKDPRLEVLGYLSTAYQLDGNCHALKPDEREGLKLQVEALRKSLKIDKDLLSGPPPDIKCDGGLAKLLFDMARAKPQDQGTDKDDSGDMGWKNIQDEWAKHFKELPAGKLGAFEGCWTGSIEGMETSLCIMQKGDLVRFRLGSVGASHCSFQDGGARQRQGYVMFFTPAASSKCVDGSPIQHAEGGCKPIDAGAMECVVSIYKKDNEIYETKNGKPISGTVTLKRSSAPGGKQ